MAKGVIREKALQEQLPVEELICTGATDSCFRNLLVQQDVLTKLANATSV